MGWNDRLPEDPYTPAPEYYHDRDEYEAWLEYVETRLIEQELTGLTSQNLDPSALKAEPPLTFLQQIWRRITGQKRAQKNNKETEDNHKQKEEQERLPF